MTRKPYIRKVSRTRWWFKQARYVRYMMREISSVFIGAYVLILIVGLFRLSQGMAVYEQFTAALLGPAGRVFSVVALAFALYHTITWFQVTPKAMPLVISGTPVPGAIIIAAHWLGFVLASGLLWLLLGA